MNTEEKFFAQMGGIIIKFDINYDQAYHLYRRGLRVRWDRFWHDRKTYHVRPGRHVHRGYNCNTWYTRCAKHLYSRSAISGPGAQQK